MNNLLTTHPLPWRIEPGSDDCGVLAANGRPVTFCTPDVAQGIVEMANAQQHLDEVRSALRELDIDTLGLLVENPDVFGALHSFMLTPDDIAAFERDYLSMSATPDTNERNGARLRAMQEANHA